MSAPNDEGDRQGGGQRRPDRPEYTVYRSRPRLLDRLRGRDPSSPREPTERQPRQRGERVAPPGRPPWRRILKWAGIAALVWLAIGLVSFAISAQVQKSKLADDVEVGAVPLMPAVAQTILVLGTDIRSSDFAGPAEQETDRCLEQVGAGNPTGRACRHGPYRSDTLLLVRAGGGSFRQLSLPRDTIADVPGVGVTKINSAYTNGGASLTVEAVEQYFGFEIDQVAIVDFDGFRRFIDAIGGVKVDLPKPVCTRVSDGTFNLDLRRGEHTLNGFQAITLARTRTAGDCDEDGFPDQSITDIDRTRFQQLILEGIKGRLTSITRLPYNFIKGPFIGWAAPRAMVSSMGAFTMPELVLAAAIGGTETIRMRPSSLDPLVFPQEQCERAARRFLGKSPPNTPACSP
jgi:LCP family protein required for cell wall assembly